MPRKVVDSPRLGQQVMTETPQIAEVTTARPTHAPAQLLGRETEVLSAQDQVVRPCGCRAVEAILVLWGWLTPLLLNLGLLLLLFTGGLVRPALSAAKAGTNGK